MLLALFLFTQCNEDKDPIFCTEEFVYGLNITVKDANTSSFITENITIIVRDGEYEEQLMTFEGNDNFLGAGERPGSYVLEITAEGYDSYTSEIIQVESDECHVIPEVLEILLLPI
jgi:predicted  nucleic acid-binding Zn-ribbon protein